ncbi:MAG: tyrosine-type recombinase/integrase, partial [Saprospiraceae bacterium]|nr:tyrosine-type recombinase/integrase [Saprospiraceae bacterium]
MIIIKPLFHREKKWIGLFFDYDIDIINQLLNVPFRKFSKTHRCWYIPYTKEAFHLFKKSGLAFKIESPLNKENNILDNAETKDVTHLKVKKASVEATETKKEDITKSKYPSIVWQGGHFFIKVKYEEKTINFLRSLYGSYYSSKYSNWVCKGNAINLKLLQSHFNYWTLEKYDVLQSICKKYHPKSKVVIKAIIQNYSQLEISIKHATKVIDFIKSMPEIKFDNVRKIWTIPRDQKIVESIKKTCDRYNYKYVENVTWKVKQPMFKSKNGKDKLKYVLKDVPSKNFNLIKKYAEVFVRENYSFNTMKLYVFAFRAYINWLPPHANASDCSFDLIQTYLNELSQSKCSVQEVNRRLSAIKFYYKKIEGWSEVRLTQIVRPRRGLRLPQILSMEEVKILFSSVVNDKHLCLLYMAYGCGLRSGEIIHLKVMDVNFDREQIFVRGGKGNKDRCVMMPKVLQTLLLTYMDNYRPDYWLFKGAKSGEPYSSSSLRAVFKRALKKGGLPLHHKLHNLRHSFATHLMESGTQQ